MPIDLPVYCFTITLDHQPHKMLHRHGTLHELYYCLAGEGTQTTEKSCESMVPGELFFFPAGLDHIGNAAVDTEVTGHVLNFSKYLTSSDDTSEVVIQHLSALTASGSRALQLERSTLKNIRKLLKAIEHEEDQQQLGYESYMWTLIRQLLILIMRDPLQTGTSLKPEHAGNQRRRIAKVLRNIQSQYMDNITVESMARLAGMSRSHFHVIFKQETGQLLTEYVNEVRIKEARQMLEKTDLPILDISMACGYPSLSHFYKTFQHLTNQTPRQFRQSIQSTTVKA